MILETERLLVRNSPDSDVNSYMILSQDVGYNCFSRPGYFSRAEQALHNTCTILFMPSCRTGFTTFLALSLLADDSFLPAFVLSLSSQASVADNPR